MATLIHFKRFKEFEGAGRDKSCNELPAKCSEINFIPVYRNIWLNLKNVICLTRYMVRPVDKDKHRFIDIYIYYIFSFRGNKNGSRLLFLLNLYNFVVRSFIEIIFLSFCEDTFMSLQYILHHLK